MNIHEYQARQFLAQYGVPVAEGRVCTTVAEVESAVAELGFPLVIKAQVHVGGRGKAGGVKLVKKAAEATEAAKAILGMDLKGFTVGKVLVVPAAAIKKEFYVSVTLDRENQRQMFVVSKAGGVDIEEVAETSPGKIKMIGIDPAEGLSDYKAREVASKLFKDIKHIRQAAKIFQSMYACAIEQDFSLLEINPLILNKEGNVEAIDAKVNIDDNALFRHPSYAEELRDLTMEDEMEVKADAAGLAFVSLDGDIGCLVNGAGLAMATLDVVNQHGGAPANFLDIGGSSNPKKVVAALEIIMSNPKVKAILFNIFGGITRCDDVANGLITALDEIDVNVPIVIRLTGTNEEEARVILKNSGKTLTPAETMAEAVEKAVALAKA